MRKLERGSRLVVASHNPGKVWEIEQLLAPYEIDAVSAAGLGLPEPEETEATFEGNARLKALAAARACGLPALGDDSGIEVDALDGAPGIYTARWAGPEKDFTIAMRRVHDELVKNGVWANTDADSPPPCGEGLGVGVTTTRNVAAESKTDAEPVSGVQNVSPLDHTPTPNPSPQGGGGQPRANFISVLCLAWPDGETALFEGRVDGHLVWPWRGENGFGFDPMFVPDGETETFGEMIPAKKYSMSHRTRAFQKLVEAALA